jgi:S-adenosylmethionine:tRNA ribosyltransferase-isomerase
MRVSDFDYSFPPELLATHPPKVRGQSRLLVLDKQTSEITHRSYQDMADYLQAGDVVVLNDTKVIKARIIAINAKGNPRELLLIEKHAEDTDWHTHRCLYRGKIETGEQLRVADALLTVEAIEAEGVALIKSSQDLAVLAEQVGSVPLPPYMKRDATMEDIERYQTVFARDPGSVAAPTASLNFTDDLRRKLEAKGVVISYLTLHVGLGTFLPIRSDEVEGHHMHSEYFEIPETTVAALQTAKYQGNRVCAIGTTVTRTLEYCAGNILSGEPVNISGEADIFIYPGYEFKVVDTLLTNFHAPKSTVLMLAAAFAGWNNLKHAYNEAIKEKYAFLSYGDSMIII